MHRRMFAFARACVFMALPFLASAAVAQDMIEPIDVVAHDSGDTAWMLTSSALVLLMTLPGLALFYGGLVRTKNILSVLMQCMIAAGLVGVLWVVVGFSIAFGSKACSRSSRRP